LDAKNGLVRQWTGALFLETVVEERPALPRHRRQRPRVPRGIIRCTLATGTGEIVVPLSGRPVKLAG
jgi:hypothetical protein